MPYLATILITLLAGGSAKSADFSVIEEMSRMTVRSEAEPIYRATFRPESEDEFQCFSIASGSVQRSHFYPERERTFRSKAGVPIVKKIKLAVITRARKRYLTSESKALE